MWFYQNGTEYKGTALLGGGPVRIISEVGQCPRCGGSGAYPSSLYNGVCFECNGHGKVKQAIRVYTTEGLEKYQARKAARIAKVEAKRAARIAARLAEVKARAEHFEATHPGLIEALRKIENNRVAAGYVAHFEREGILYEYQIEAAQALLEKAAKEAANLNEHFGQVGEKIELVLTLTHTYHGQGHFGAFSYVNFEDAQGRAFIWKASTHVSAEKGQLKVKGTIKEHSEYQGRKQTVLSRCKISEVK